MDEASNFYRWLALIGIPTALAAALAAIIWLALNIEKLEAIGALAARLLSRWSSASERKFIELDIQSKIGDFSKAIIRDVGVGTQPRVKIQWVNTDEIDPEAFVRNGQLVLRMSAYKRHEENVVNATIAYIRKTVLFRARPYFHRVIDSGVDLTLSNKVFRLDKNPAVLEHFHEHLVRPVVQKDPELGEYLARLDQIDGYGYLTKIFLREVAKFGDKFPSVARPQDLQETKDFADFLYQIATREPEEEVPLHFRGRTVRTGIILIARRGRARTGVINPYLDAASVHIQQGAQSLHLCAWGQNVSFAKTVIEALTKDMRVYFGSKDHYDQEMQTGEKVPAIWAYFRSVVT